MTKKTKVGKYNVGEDDEGFILPGYLRQQIRAIANLKGRSFGGQLIQTLEEGLNMELSNTEVLGKIWAIRVREGSDARFPAVFK